MAEVSARVEGLRDLERNLETLANEYGPNNAVSALRPTVRSLLKPISEYVRSRTPVDTGVLRESAGLRVVKPTRRLLRNPENRNLVLIGEVGWIWRTPTRLLFERAISIEYGNVKTPAHRILRDALKQLDSAVTSEFVPTLARNIERAATRLSRRRAAGTLRRR